MPRYARLLRVRIISGPDSDDRCGPGGPRSGKRGLRRRLSRAGRGVAFGEVEDLDEGRGRLGAGGGVLAVDDEARHAVDAEAPRIDVGGNNLLAALVAHQVATGTQLVDAGAAGAFYQDLEVADVEALLEVGLEQLGH